MTSRVAVVGAGWAGLSCAHWLLREGFEVTLLDSAPKAGGRARSAFIQLAGCDVELDNGQHMLIGAYRQTLALIDELGQGALLLRAPFQFRNDALDIMRRGPGRIGLAWGILSARGLQIADRVALLQFGLHITRRRWRGFEMMTVGDLLQQTGQTDKLTATIWRPLCVAALNTEPEQACAQTFVNVLRDALFSGADASDFLISRAPLSQLFAAPMLSGLRQRGLNWLPAQGLQALTRHQDNRWHLQLRAQNILAEQVVLATPWHVSASMLHSVQPSAAMALERLQPEPIRTVYLAWPSHLNVRLPDIAMLRDDPAQGRPGQWLFAREHQQDLAIAAVVISAAGSIRIDNATIAEQAAKQVSDQLGLPKPVDQRCINEKRATFLCTPDRPQVSATEINAEPLPAGLFLAGDYCYHRYPATLEAATISARLAAQACRELLAPGRRDAQLSNA